MKNLFRSSLLLLITIALVSSYGYGQIPQGRWTFDNTLNLTAAVPGFGKDLVLVGTDSAVAGPVAGNGAVRIPLGSYFKLAHGFAPNGGGTLRVNEYSIMIDFKLLNATKWYTFFQTDSTNTSDGELFVKPTTGVIGNGTTGYSTIGVIDTSWHRLVVSVKNGTQFDTYLDGVLLKTGTAQYVDSSRFALDPLLLMFADNDGDDAPMDVAELEIWNRPLTANEIAELGTPIPVKRQSKWTFDDPSNLTVVAPGFGKDLVLGGLGKDSAVAGPSPGNGAVRVPLGSYLKLTHGFAPNGGGTLRVNEYSIMVDFRLLDNTKWYTFYQTDTTNVSDGECFIKPTTGVIGTAATGYSTTGVTDKTWHRFVLSNKNGTHHNLYLDGVLIKAGTAQNIDSSRWALEKYLLMLGDNDGDDADIDIAEMRMWNYSLTDGDVTGLGKVFVDSVVVGKWTFDNPLNLTAAVPGFGKDLVRGGLGKDTVVAGPSASNGAVRVPKGSYYKLTHGFTPNGGGADSLHRVNAYSIMVDFRLPDNTKWYNFFQTNPSNTDDGECFIKPNTGVIGTAATGYSATGVTDKTWHRLVVSIQNGLLHNYYLDGKLLYAGSALAVDGRFALDSLLLMFGDDDGDDADIDVAEVQMWNYPLSASDVTKLGKVLSDHVTFQVNMKVQMKIKKFDKAKDTVVVRGDFQGWGGNAYKLTDPDGDSVYAGTFSVPGAPKKITYKYVMLSPNVAGDQWETSSDRKDSIPSTPMTLPVTWFSFDSTTVYSDNFITFQVNMKKQMRFAKFDKAKDSVVVRGDFNGWGGNTHLLADPNTDSIYTGTYNITSVKKIIYKFVIHKATGDVWPSSKDRIDSLLNGTPRTEPVVWFENDSVLTGVRRDENAIATTYELLQNYPNPFNPTTKIDFSILADGLVSLKVYNLLGQEVATIVNQQLNAGKHIATFNASNLSSGVYFYKIEAGSFTSIKKMMVLK
ncbi:MAG: LamG-like jellyroll fold domain-containing protein [Bacteroidota bacterium]|nr:LamG-like jellyroll fold domain-containing protein [Bacteroidota bacterium]